MVPGFLHYSRFTSEDSFFRVQKIGWRLTGFWIGSDEISNFKFGLLLFNCFEVLIFGVCQIYCSYLHRENIVEFLEIFEPMITQVPTILRLLVLVYYRKNLKHVLDYLKKIFDETVDRDELKLVAQGNQISTLVLSVMWFFVISTDLGYIFYPIFKNIYRYFIGLPRIFDLPFKASFPFEIEYSPMFEIIYILSTHSGNMTATSICAGDGIIFGSCFHLASQFEILALRLKNVAQREIGEMHELTEKFSKEQNEKLREKLIEIVNLHNEAIEKCEILTKTFSKNILIQFVFASLIMCISGLLIIKSTDASGLIHITYIASYFTLAFNYALGGNSLINSSTNVSAAAYEFPWYKCDIEIRKIILLIMIRAQRKVNIKVPFFEVSMETYSTILRVFSSFFTLAKTFM